MFSAQGCVPDIPYRESTVLWAPASCHSSVILGPIPLFGQPRLSGMRSEWTKNDEMSAQLVSLEALHIPPL